MVEVVVGVEVMVLVLVAIGDTMEEPCSLMVVYSTTVEVTVVGVVSLTALATSASLTALATSASEAVAGTVNVVEGKVMVINLSTVTVVSCSPN